MLSFTSPDVMRTIPPWKWQTSRLRECVLTHVDVDWHLPGDRLGTPGFADYERPDTRGRAASQTPRRLMITADSQTVGVLPEVGWMRSMAGK